MGCELFVDDSLIGLHAAGPEPLGFVCSALGADLSLLEMPPRCGLCGTSAGLFDTLPTAQRTCDDAPDLDLLALEGHGGSTHLLQPLAVPVTSYADALADPPLEDFAGFDTGGGTEALPGDDTAPAPLPGAYC